MGAKVPLGKNIGVVIKRRRIRQDCSSGSNRFGELDGAKQQRRRGGFRRGAELFLAPKDSLLALPIA